MQTLKKFMDQIQEPDEDTLIHKDECCYSFDTAESPGGLYVNLNSYLGFSEKYARLYAEHSGNPVFVHIKKERLPANMNEKGEEIPAPQRLAIGVEGGFAEDAGKPKFKDVYNLVVMQKKNQIVTIPLEKVSDQIAGIVETIIGYESAKKKIEKSDVTGTWDGEVRRISKFSETLVQLPTDKVIPPSGWKCEKCDLTQNLWMNLTDGAILCGRKFSDGSGGNNHALLHYVATGYPLAVKLGTISEKGLIDVFSYAEDDVVIDTNLEKHLAHFGIQIRGMKKSDKTMIEIELELNQTDKEWTAYSQKEGSSSKQITGPGYTGMINMGNTCYINSVMQVLFSITDFKERFTGEGAEEFFFKFPPDPLDDINIQLSKLGNGLWSGEYSKPYGGIKPATFKHLIGKGHPDFGTRQQQDAFLFFLYVMEILQFKFKGLLDPADALRFCLEERIECTTSKKVKYSLRPEITLQLEIPLKKAINFAEATEYAEEAQRRKYADVDTDVVRYRIPLKACLDKFFASEYIEQFYSTAVQRETIARKRLRMATFPDYLMMHMRKFTLDKDWNPCKLDVSIQMPDEINLEEWRGVGLKPEEEQLSSHQFSFNVNILQDLVQMGYSPDASMRALYSTHNRGLAEATNWLLDHSRDPDIEDPFVAPNDSYHSGPAAGGHKFFPDPTSLLTVMKMGYNENQAARALDAADGSVPQAKAWLEKHASSLNELSAPIFRNGSSVYQLVAFVSHMGPSCQNGHYIAHVLRDDQWVMFNDERVTISKNPQKDLGYMYLYKRKD